jgi:hypothetical protein
MATLNDLRLTGVAYAKLAQNAVDELYKMLVKTGFGAIVLVLIMWGLNAAGQKEVNWAFFFLGIILFAIWSFAPVRLLIAAGAGAAIEGLKDEDLTRGAVRGVTTWYQVILGVMLWFMITAAILSVISFQAKPGNFFPIVAMLLLITVGYAAVKNGTVKSLIATFGTIVIFFSLWALVPQDWKFWANWGDSSSQPQVPAGPPAIVVRPKVSEGQAVWKEPSKDDSLPVGIWSEVTKVGVGCRVDFALGDGHVVEYRFYNKEWKTYQAGTSPNASHLRFQVTKEGLTELPYVMTCS